MDEQAHAMSHPDAAKATRGERRKLVEMALWYRDAWKAAQAEIKRLSAELAARTDAWEAAEWKLRGELSDARAEIVKLLEEVARLRGCAPTCEGAQVVGKTESNCLLHPKAPSLAMVADTLDPRLGTPQPDGEPVAPMSARKPYRWGML